ncbi:MAG: NAD(P)-dependent oxidoreductase [Burkholderiaceae bacterium]
MNILLTGAGGGVGRMLRPMMIDTWGKLRLSDIADPGPLADGEQFAPADLTDPAALDEAVAGIDGIVHLGGHSVEGSWDTILQANIIGTYNLFEAARKAGVRRVVFASSNHAVGFHERSHTIDQNVPVRPDSRYGVSKVFGEGVAALYAHKHGIRSTSLRIGNVGLEPLDRRRLSIWIHPEDLMQLVRIGLEHPDVHCEVLYGASANQRTWWDRSRAHALGYRPTHKSEDFADASPVTATKPPTRSPTATRASTFCAAEYSPPELTDPDLREKDMTDKAELARVADVISTSTSSACTKATADRLHRRHSTRLPACSVTTRAASPT